MRPTAWGPRQTHRDTAAAPSREEKEVEPDKQRNCETEEAISDAQRKLNVEVTDLCAFVTAIM